MSLTRWYIDADAMLRCEERYYQQDVDGNAFYKAEDVRAVFEPFLHRIVISARTPQELKDWAYRLLQEIARCCEHCGDTRIGVDGVTCVWCVKEQS